MAITLRGTPVSNNARSTTVSATFTVVAGDFLVCAVASSTGITINTPTGGGGTWNAVTAAATSGTTAVRMFWNSSPTAGSQTISCITNTGRDSEICVAAFSGVATSSPIDNPTLGNGFNNGTGLSASVVTSVAGDLIIAAGGGAANTAFVAGNIGGTAANPLTNQSGVANSDQGSIGMEYLVVGSPTTYVASFSSGAASPAIQVVAFLAATSSTPISSLMMMGCGA